MKKTRPPLDLSPPARRGPGFSRAVSIVGKIHR